MTIGKLKTTEEFIIEAISLHGDRFDYSKVKYKGAHTNVTIVCVEHGEFTQTPHNHLHNKGCSKCSRKERTKTLENFISDARVVHGDKYKYNKVKYVSSQSKITIVCNEHGEFEQSPNLHLRGNGCPSCTNKKVVSTSTFIAQASLIHNYLYSYTRTDYVTSWKKVIIICTIHGEFEQAPANHLYGKGCPKCIGRDKTTEEFVLKAIEVHGNKYDYSLSEYTRSKDKVAIICNKHGIFRQIPRNHLNGCGCPKCAKYGFDASKDAIFYIYTFGDYVGFGITNDFVTRNTRHICNFKKAGVDSKLIATYNMSGESAQLLERRIKKLFSVIDSGIEGFRIEALQISSLQRVLDTIKEYINDPEI